MTDARPEAESVERSRGMRCVTDENGHVVDLLLIAESAREQHGESCGPCRKQPSAEEYVRFDQRWHDLDDYWHTRRGSEANCHEFKPLELLAAPTRTDAGLLTGDPVLR